jgi:hypothetical protein
MKALLVLIMASFVLTKALFVLMKSTFVLTKTLLVGYVVQWLVWRCKDLMILTSCVQIPLWDMDVVLWMRSYKPRAHITVQ